MKKIFLIAILALLGLSLHSQTDNKPVYKYNDVNIDSIDVHIVQLYATITMLKYGFVMGLKFGDANGDYHWKDRDDQILTVNGNVVDMEDNNPAVILNILYECGFKLVGQSSNQISSNSARTWIYYTLAKD